MLFMRAIFWAPCHATCSTGSCPSLEPCIACSAQQVALAAQQTIRHWQQPRQHPRQQQAQASSCCFLCLGPLPFCCQNWARARTRGRPCRQSCCCGCVRSCSNPKRANGAHEPRHAAPAIAQNRHCCRTGKSHCLLPAKTRDVSGRGNNTVDVPWPDADTVSPHLRALPKSSN